jgi:hypothetical protein
MQCFERFSPSATLRRELESLGMNNRFQVKKRTIKQFVDYNEVKLMHLCHFNRCVFEP